MDVGPVSMESHRRIIGVALEFARQRGYARTNPAADVKIARKVLGDVTVLTPAELKTLLCHCPPQTIPYMTTCAFAGLRPSEAEALGWSNVHLDLMQIEVKAKHSKTRRHRFVPIHFRKSRHRFDFFLASTRSAEGRSFDVCHWCGRLHQRKG